MTKVEIIELYIRELECQVGLSPARNMRISILKEELSKSLLIPNLSKCYSLGTKLLLNSNDLQDEEVVILDLTSSGCPYVCGENFEGFIPQLTMPNTIY